MFFCKLLSQQKYRTQPSTGIWNSNVLRIFTWDSKWSRNVCWNLREKTSRKILPRILNTSHAKLVLQQCIAQVFSLLADERNVSSLISSIVYKHHKLSIWCIEMKHFKTKIKKKSCSWTLLRINIQIAKIFDNVWKFLRKHERTKCKMFLRIELKFFAIHLFDI